jgi:hypothetical protein
MAVGDPQLGNDFTLHYDSDHNWTTPVWVHASHVEDLAVDYAPQGVPIPIRGQSWIKYGQGRNDFALTFTIQYDNDDAFVEALLAAAESGDDLHVAVCDNETTDLSSPGTGVHYWHAPMVVTGWSRDMSLESAAMWSVELRIADTANDPALVEA